MRAAHHLQCILDMPPVFGQVELADGDTLLPNWHAAKDSEGRLYFYCTLTGEVSWHKPLVRPRR